MPSIRLLTTAEAAGDLLTEIRRLLVDAFDGDFTEHDWAHTLGGWHVVVTDEGIVVAHAGVVSRTLEVADRPRRAGYVEGVGVAPARHGQRLGSLAMAEASALVRRELELGALSTGRHHFYERLGWERWRGPTYARHGAELVRTEDDDDSVMVLRFGPSVDIDLTSVLICEGRPGDDW